MTQNGEEKIQANPKEERFCRVAEARVNKLIKMIRLLGNCSGTATYVYKPSQVVQIFDALQREIEKAHKRFGEQKKNTRNSFSLSEKPSSEKEHPSVSLTIPGGNRLRATAYATADYPAVNIYLERDKEEPELLCFVEHNPDHEPGSQLCIGVYCASKDDTVYYESYFADENPESYNENKGALNDGE